MSAIARWVWEAQAPGARLVRLALAPAALGFRTATRVRASVYGTGLFPQTRLPRPTISVGSLAAGGAGKTPVASWVAAFYGARGARPGVLLRGYGGDEGEIHRRAVPEAIVVERPDRVSAAREAVRRGADVIVLDDGFQRLDVIRDLDIVLVAAESLATGTRTVPSGPWREAWSALARADLAVLTRKRVPPGAALVAADRLRAWLRPGCPVARAALRISRLRGLWSQALQAPAALAGARVLAVAGVADPRTFGVQLEGFGAEVVLAARPDHYAYRARDAQSLAREAGRVDLVVMTEKDATKLRSPWPRGGPEPLVAELDVVWESGARSVERALTRARQGHAAGADGSHERR